MCLLFPLPIPFILTITNCTSSCRHRATLVWSHGHSLMPVEGMGAILPRTLQPETAPIPKVCFSVKHYCCFSMGIKWRLARIRALLLGPCDYFGSQKQNWSSDFWGSGLQPAPFMPARASAQCSRRQCYLGKLTASRCAHLVHDTRNNKCRTRRLNGIFQTPIKHLLELRLQLQTYSVLSEETLRLIPCQHPSLITHSLLFLKMIMKNFSSNQHWMFTTCNLFTTKVLFMYYVMRTITTFLPVGVNYPCKLEDKYVY